MPSVDRDYFGWQHAAHAKGCYQGWEVRAREDESAGHSDLVVQAICPLPSGCGAVYEWGAHLAPDRDENQPSGTSYSGGSVARIGYGTAPIKVGDVWLHAGAPLLHRLDATPHYYIVTASKASPTQWADVLGTVGQIRKRGRVSERRWWARAGYRPGMYEYWSPAHATDDCTSRGGAVGWVLQYDAPVPAKQSAGGA